MNPIAEVSAPVDIALTMLDVFPPPVMPESNYDEAALALWAHMYEEARTSEPRDYDGNRGHWWHGSLGAAIKTVWPTLTGRQIANAQASIAPRLRKRNMLANIKSGTGSTPSKWWVAMPPSGVTSPKAAEPQPEPAQDAAPALHTLPPTSLVAFTPDPTFEREPAPEAVAEQEPAVVAGPTGGSASLDRLQEMIETIVQERTGETRERVEAVRKGLYEALGELDGMRVRVHALLEQLD